MKVLRMPVGVLMANCYIVFCERTKEAVIVDPGGDTQKIIMLLEKNNLKALCVINTHGHADHMSGNRELREKLRLPVYIHQDDAYMLVSAKENLSNFIGKDAEDLAADRLLKDGDEIQFGLEKLTVIHTPGHTRGGICLLGDNFILTGDTLFSDGEIGRTDLKGGSYPEIINSIKTKLWILNDDLIVYPGHEQESTIGREKKMNNYVNSND